MIEWEKLSNFASRNKKIALHIYKVQVRFSFVSEPFQVRSLQVAKMVLQAVEQSNGITITNKFHY